MASLHLSTDHRTPPGPECARSSGVRRMRSSRMRRPGPASAPVRKKPCWRAPRRRAARAAPGRASGRPGPPGLRRGARHGARAAPLGAQVARALGRQPGQLLAGHHHLPERRVHHRLARVARGHAAPAGPVRRVSLGLPCIVVVKLLTQRHARVCRLLWLAAGPRVRPRRRHARRQVGAPACRRLPAVRRSTSCSSRRCPERRLAAGAPQVRAARAFGRHRHESFRLASLQKVPAGSAGGTGRWSPGCRRCT